MEGDHTPPFYQQGVENGHEAETTWPDGPGVRPSGTLSPFCRGASPRAPDTHVRTVGAIVADDESEGKVATPMRVEMRDSESFDQLLKRFTKTIERSGVIREHRRGLRFISVQEENRAKRRKAERRRRRNAA